MNDSKYNKWLFAVIILIIIIFVQLNKIDKIKQSNVTLQDEISNLENSNNDLSYALDEANDNIERANSSIEDAQGYAWSSYDDMGYALDGLETVYTVNNPN